MPEIKAKLYSDPSVRRSRFTQFHGWILESSSRFVRVFVREERLSVGIAI